MSSINLKENLKEAFKFDRFIPRFFASWFFFYLILIFIYKDSSILSFAQNVNLFLAISMVLLIFILLSIPILFFNKIHIDSLYLFFISTVLIFYLLARNYEGDFLRSLGFFLIYAFILVFTYVKNKDLLSKANPNNLTMIICVSLISLTSLIIASVGAYFMVRTLSSPNFDYGLFTNVFYNLKTKGLPLSTCERNTLLSHFKVHISPIFYVMLPVYLIFPHAETLNVLQSILVGIGIIPIILIMKNDKRSNMEMILMAFIYSFNSIIWTSGNYDFHENCALIAPILFLYYFYKKKNYIGMGISSVLVLLVKEDAFFYLLVFGIYILIKDKRWIEGLLLIVLPVVYFVIAVSILNKYGTGAMDNRYGTYIYEDGGLISAFKTIVLNPGYAIKNLFSNASGGSQKLIYILELMVPLGFIPLFIKKPGNLILLTPILLNILSDYTYMSDIGFQYHYGIMAFLFILYMENLNDMKEEYIMGVRYVTAFITLAMYFAFVLPDNLFFTNAYIKNKDYYEAKIAVLEGIDKDKSVSANTFFITYLHDRDVIYETYYHKKELDVEVVVLNKNDSYDKELYKFYTLNGYEVTFDGYDMYVLESPN